MWDCQTLLIVIFAFLGNTAVLIAYSYPAGFILDYLEGRGAHMMLGTLSISLCQITTVISPFVVRRFPRFMAIDIKWRSFIMSTVGFLCSAAMAGIDFLPNTPALILMAVSRSLLGAVLGVFFVIVQGEIVDRYLADNNGALVCISSGVYVGNTLGGIMGTWLMAHGGWRVAGPVVGAFSILPVLFLPFIKTTDPSAEYIDLSEEDDLPNPTDNLTLLQHFSYYMPDHLFFMNNVTFSILTFVVPFRMERYMGKSLEETVYELNIICTIVILPGVAIAYLVSKRLDVILSTIFWNIVFYSGAILMYTSSSDSFAFGYEFIVSALFVGLSDVIVTNMIVLSKFVLFEKWKKDITGLDLGQHASRVFNISDSLGHIAGAVLSTFSSYKGAETYTITVFCVLMATTTLGAVMSKISEKDSNINCCRIRNNSPT